MARTKKMPGEREMHEAVLLGLGEHLMNWRMSLGWDQQQAADYFGIGRRTYQRMETCSEDPNPRLLTLVKMCAATGAELRLFPRKNPLPSEVEHRLRKKRGANRAVERSKTS